MQWLGTLASRLVRDTALADDACQEAWLAASASGPTDRPPGRLALLRALRRFLWSNRRAEARRKKREQQVAIHNPLPSTDELLLRGEQRALLWRHLAELDEPYRSTLLLRFQEQLETASIARRQNIAADTVRWRIRRGLELLRIRLTCGANRMSLAGLVAAAPASAGWSISATGTLTSVSMATTDGVVSTISGVWMTKNVLTVAVCAVVALLGSWKILSNGSENPPPARATPLATTTPDTPPPEAGAEVESQRPPMRQVVPDTPQQVDQGSCLAGRILDAGGQPLPGIKIALESKGRWNRTGQSGADGSFALACPRQTAKEIWAVISGSAFLERREFCIGSSPDCDAGALTVETVDLGTVKLRATGIVTGRCVDHRGDPIGSGWLRFRPADCYLQADPDGRFRIEHALPGSGRLEVSVGGYLEAGFKVTVTAGQATALGDLALETSPRVSGIVTDTQGRPLTGATVSSRGFTRGWVFQADTSGRFDIPLPEEGTGRVLARAPGFRQSEGLAVLPGTQDVRIRLASAGVRCQLRFVDATTGQPIGDFGLRVAEKPRVRPPVIRRRPAAPISFTARPGVDTFDVLAKGYRRKQGPITADATSGGVQSITMVPAPATEIVGRITKEGIAAAGANLVLLSGKPGRIQDPTDKNKLLPLPSPEFKVTLKRGFGLHTVTAIDADPPGLCLSSWGRSRRRATAGADGRFRFKGLSAGLYRLVATSDNGIHRSRLLLLRAGQRLDLGNLTLLHPVSLRGRIVPSAGGRLDGHTVSVMGDPSLSTKTTIDGEFELPGVPPGPCFLSVKAGGGLHARSLFLRYYLRLDPGRERFVALPIKTFAACELKLSASLNGKSMSGAKVTFRPKSSSLPWTSSVLDAAGNTHISVPAATPLSIHFEIEGSELRWPTTRTMPPGGDRLRLEFESSALVIALPADLALPDHGQAILHWRLGAGGDRHRISRSLAGNELRLLPASERQLVFPHVPVRAVNLRLEVQERGPAYGQAKTLLSRPVTARLEPGGRVEGK